MSKQKNNTMKNQFNNGDEQGQKWARGIKKVSGQPLLKILLFRPFLFVAKKNHIVIGGLLLKNTHTIQR